MALFRDLISKTSSPAKKLIAIGNQARDAKDWEGATEAYRSYLALVPDDAALWVQYGHALKERALLSEAEAAYRQATTLNPADPDSRLHLGHLLKRLDRPRQAAAVFRELLLLAPTGEAMSELQALGYGSQAQLITSARSDASAKPRRCLELKDLFQYLSFHTTVTGITRVTLALLNYILEELDEEEASSYKFVHQFGDGEGVLLIPNTKMRRMIQMAMGDEPDLSDMQSLIGEIRSTSPFIHLQTGDLYFIVGAFWEFVANPSWISGMKQKGVIIGAYLYDLIPITHPNYCMSGLTDAFTLAFSETARLLDFSFTISEYVAKEVDKYLTQNNIEKFPISAVQLAHELRFSTKNAVKHRSTSAKIGDLEETDFVLCICTIEARKNHAYLVQIWQKMINAGINVPDLVFVGRPGWRVQDLFDQIEASRHLGGQLHILHGLSDDDLEALYDRCLFTVFPSFVEGWGLPVGESLARGRLCVASSTTSIPEVGGSFAVYVDPFDLQDGYKKISSLIINPQSVAGLEAKLRQDFKARTWSDVGKDFFAKIDSAMVGVGKRSSKPIFGPLLRSGEMFTERRVHSDETRNPSYVANPIRLAFSAGWRSADPTGTWMRDNIARFRVLTNCKPEQNVSILLHVGSSPWVGNQHTLRISASRQSAQRRARDDSNHVETMRSDRDFWIKLKGEIDEHGYLTVQFRIDGTVTPTNGILPLALRLHAIGYAATNDIEQRVELVESALLLSEILHQTSHRPSAEPEALPSQETESAEAVPAAGEKSLSLVRPVNGPPGAFLVAATVDQG